MALKLFELVEDFTVNVFMMKITQFEKNGSICKFFFYFAGKLKH